MKLTHVILGCTAVLASVLIFLPTKAQPVAWTPPPAPDTSKGRFAENQHLAALKRLGQHLKIAGPEAIVVDANKRVITGLADGRIVRFSSDFQTMEILADTGGRPLGMAFHPDGRLIIADAKKGLLALDPQTQGLGLLTNEADGVKVGFADDVAVSSDGQFAYFSDASTRWGYGKDAQAVMEHGGDGRLLRYDFATQTTTTLMKGLEFANGVALGPNEDCVVVNETGAYRVARLWLKGEKAGQRDYLIENLPGLPDNITFNGKDRYWLALYSPRNPLLDLLAQFPEMRKALIRALDFIPKPVEHRAMALGLNEVGSVVANLQDNGSDNYSPITSVRESGDSLYFGSLSQNSIAVMPMQAVKNLISLTPP
ncbi:MAG: SMP-30/gluconolactonase/LRE family protein [Burkholderiales bacterium]|nr:SMP-30/gluconolactonase/LRE family protein [Burkholderiales bacterium]